jgi:hypothetical protein
MEEQNVENIGKKFDEIIEKTAAQQNRHLQAAQTFGYIKITLETSKDLWANFGERPEPEYKRLTVSGSAFLSSLSDELDEIDRQTVFPNILLDTAASTVDIFSADTTALAQISQCEPPLLPPYNYQPFPLRRNSDFKANIERFAKVDPALGEVYAQVGEALYSTSAEPERSAMFQMRQTFDHFFQILAPDNEIKSSEFWKLKKGSNPNQIFREERVQFAAHKHVIEPLVRDSLLSKTNLLLDAYQLLNSAHKRGTVDKQKARSALFAMQRLLEEWLNGIEKKHN